MVNADSKEGWWRRSTILVPEVVLLGDWDVDFKLGMKWHEYEGTEAPGKYSTLYIAYNESKLHEKLSVLCLNGMEAYFYLHFQRPNTINDKWLQFSSIRDTAIFMTLFFSETAIEPEGM